MLANTTDAFDAFLTSFLAMARLFLSDHCGVCYAEPSREYRAGSVELAIYTGRCGWEGDESRHATKEAHEGAKALAARFGLYYAGTDTHEKGAASMEFVKANDNGIFRVEMCTGRYHVGGGTRIPDGKGWWLEVATTAGTFRHDAKFSTWNRARTFHARVTGADLTIPHLKASPHWTRVED